MKTFTERKANLTACYEGNLARLNRELLVHPIIEYWENKWSPISKDPKDTTVRYSTLAWNSMSCYLAEEDTTKCINLFIEAMLSDPRILSVSDAQEDEKHVGYVFYSHIKGRWTRTESFVVHFYFDRSKFCHASVTKVETERHKYVNKTYKLQCS